MALGTNGLVIRRVKKIKKGGHHGGAWKIALADFALAMMALFLVLWLLSVASPEELASIEGYFHDPMGPSTAGFSANPIDLGGSPAKSPEKKLDLQLPDPGSTDLPMKDELLGNGPDSAESNSLNNMLQEAMSNTNVLLSQQQNLRIEITPLGVRITLLDNPDKPMFERGSARMMPDIENTLLTMSPIFNRITNPIVITGHTDSSKFSGDRLDNWDLSALRANAARRILEEGGVADKRFAQVIGLSDTIPYNRFDTDSAENRRISITLLTDEAYRKLLDQNRRFFGNPAQQSDLKLTPETVF
ncbi:MAG: flagellar motor protein MotB [Marinomonas sp.]|jgi:chemotaxis protein MotB|uniref:Flagellar motor protein MotB n=1 Tax=Marinomonas pontica TaxID=264739 RepID=A0ABM8FDE1_9GAMM|nr:flagellar motor protein MotB [Marinomonas pontica]MCW8355479.1 OmpA family protein [Marinomonas pontica]BDX03118.1 flagellar motor protein MotB [Marinomonas pontica]